MFLRKGAKLLPRRTGNSNHKVCVAKRLHVLRMTFYSLRARQIRIRKGDRVVKDGGGMHFSPPRIVNALREFVINYFRQNKPRSRCILGTNTLDTLHYSQTLVLPPIQWQ